MVHRIPIYRIQDATYRADSCRPLSQAAETGEIQLRALSRGQYPGRNLPSDALPRLKTVGFWDSTKPQNWGLDWHQNEGIELTFLERGQLEFGVEEQDFQLNANQLTVTRPWQRHRLGNPDIGLSRLHWIILDLGVRRPHQPWQWPSWLMIAESDLKELTHILRQNEHPVWHNASRFGQCFQRISQVVEQESETVDVSWLTILINELLMHLLDLFRSQEITTDGGLSETQRTVELFLEDLRSNRCYMAEDWTVKLMAEACGLGVTRFTEYCRRLTNTTPMKHLNRLRLESAAQMIAEDLKLTNSQLARACGFSSRQYFASAFRRQFGCTPQEYRYRGSALSNDEARSTRD